MALFKAIRLAFYFVFLVAILGAYLVYLQAIDKPLDNRTKTLVVPSGVGVAWLAAHLEKEEIIDNRYIFRAFTLMNHSDASIKAGEYNLVDVNNMAELVEKLIDGRVIQYAITLVEGKTFKEGNGCIWKEKVRCRGLAKNDSNSSSSMSISSSSYMLDRCSMAETIVSKSSCQPSGK